MIVFNRLGPKQPEEQREGDAWMLLVLLAPSSIINARLKSFYSYLICFYLIVKPCDAK